MNKEEFYREKGFNDNGIGYVVLGETYSIKEKLKSDGAKFNTEIKHWILPEQLKDYSYYCISVNDIYKQCKDGGYSWNKHYDTYRLSKKIDEEELNLKLSKL